MTAGRRHCHFPVFYRFALDVEVPKLPYVTRLDAFVLASTLFVFLSLIEVLVTTKLAHCDRLAAARRIDRHARWIFPAVFIFSSAVIFLRWGSNGCSVLPDGTNA